ncbi:MAG: hypothetical protein OEW48_05105 [Phycisphaerae bacterium]|nr:hypothetical protein [Phycisphaerae bacterium]
MGSSNRCTLKITTVFLAAIFFLFLQERLANAIPTEDDINSLAEKARHTIETFMQKSFQLRMAYEYSSKFLSRRDKEKLETLAKMAGDQLPAIEASQRKIKQQIEDYQGDDWDDRYGSTGLWRKLSADLYITAEYKGQIDFYLALTARQPQRNKILHKILTQIDVSDTTYHSAELQLLRARIYSLLSRTDSSYKPLATQEFNLLMVRSDMRHSTPFRTAIERIRLFGPTVPDQLNTLAENIAKSRCKDDIELVLLLAFLQRRYEPVSLKRTVQTWPQIEDFLGSLALSDLSNRIKEGQLTEQYLQQISVFEAGLAAQAAWKNQTQQHKTLLGRLSGTEKFQTPLILYVTAIALADSSPAEAVNLLIKASTLQSAGGEQKSDKLKIEAHEIAKQAAQLAYGFYNHNSADCRLAVEAFGNYHIMAAEKIDEQLEYLYTTILNNCGQIEKSKILLEKIANRPTGHWRNRAKLDLITAAIQQSQPINREKRIEILKQLDNLITDCRRRNEDNKLRTEVINVYCRLLLESKEKASARKMLGILTDVEIAIDPNLNLFKANALRQLGKLDESAESLCEIVNSNSYKYTEAMELLSESIEKIDYFQAKLDGFPKMVKNCHKLASYCRDHAGEGDNRRIDLMLAEISTFATEKEHRKLFLASKLVNSLAKQGDANDINLLRCRARLLTAKGKFAEAARLWAQIAKMQQNNTNGAYQRTWKWWRAKFYELDCFAKTPQTEKQEILHTIEVLESSFTDIPPLWAEKLDLLKQKCRYPEK